MFKPKRDGFLRNLFMGNVKEDLVFPYPRMSQEEQEDLAMIIDSINKFEKNVDQAEIEKTNSISEDLLEEMKEMGLFGLVVPEEHDGFGLSISGYSRVLEKLTLCGAGVGVTIGAHQSIGMKGILLAGTEEQKAKYCPDLASGDLIAAFCLTEPNSGSDAASIRTRATLSEDGTFYTLSGEKQFITNGRIADFFTVFAQVEVDVNGEKQDKVTAFMVTRDMGGVKSGPEEDKFGWHGSSTTTVYFENVKVPAENLLGEVGKGFKVAMEILNNGRLSTVTASVGAARYLINMCVSYMNERKQFGKTIGNYELLKEKLAEMSMWTYAMDAMGYMTAGIVDNGEKDYSIESACSKVFGTEALWKITDHAMQIHGGMGYMCELPIERFMRDARLGLIVEGTSEILRCMIALEGLKTLGQFLKKNGIIGYAQKTFSTPKVNKNNDIFDTEASLFSKGVYKLNSYSMRFLREYKKDVIFKQFHQKRIAETVIDLYGMICTIARTSMLLENGKTKEDIKTEVYLTRSFCRMAFDRIEKRMDSFDLNHDKYLARIADTILGEDGYKSEISDLGSALEDIEEAAEQAKLAMVS